MNIFSAEQFYQADAITIQKQELGPTDLMERAGIQVFNWLHSRMHGAQVPVRIFCGIGNNGGDGLVLARHLIQHGYNVHTYVVNCSDKRSKNFLINYDRIKQVTKKWPTLITSEDGFPEIHKDDVVVDAIFGIGLNRCMDGWVKAMVQHLNAAGAFILAIDLPSGLYANAPIEDPEAVVKANHTLSFQLPKLSFFMPSTGIYTNTWEAIDLGLDPEFVMTQPPIATLLHKQHILSWYQPREKYSYKGTFGHSMLVGGSLGKMGAVVLATRAALRAGSGLATAHVPKCGLGVLQTTVPEAMASCSEEESFLNSIPLEPTHTYGIGMGMGMEDGSLAALDQFLEAQEAPVLLDADALNLLASKKELYAKIPQQSVLTPHPGELKRLLGDWTDDFDKLQKAQAFAVELQVVILIKGAHTCICTPQGTLINSTGNPGMATAGSGDVLAGMITGLMAQGYPTWQAAAMGVYLHGSSGDIAVQHLGYQALLASDITENIGNAFIKLFEVEQPPQQQEEEAQ
ncbi:NAD(P)H-hydrate dehydratase [Gilvibacter sp.]|uniref:NAD(P)H-hydrate dehydratase n=1 Tax=Gilvibacter sp. TaxID=2729997 RepID=UPI003F4A1EBE